MTSGYHGKRDFIVIGDMHKAIHVFYRKNLEATQIPVHREVDEEITMYSSMGYHEREGKTNELQHTTGQMILMV